MKPKCIKLDTSKVLEEKPNLKIQWFLFDLQRTIDLSQETIAKELKISRSSFSLLERGEKQPTKTQREKLVNLFIREISSRQI